MATARKIEISRAFDAAAGDYDKNAAPHKLVARQLVDFAARDTLCDAPTILEIGCGTGLLTRALRARWPNAHILATDIAPEMVRATEALGIADQLMVMDGEAPRLDDGQFDLIVSSLTFQWFEALPGALSRLLPSLRSGGMLCFATMGVESFGDWRRAHEREGVDCGIPDYPSLNALKAQLAKLGSHEAIEQLVPMDEAGGRALLRHFHAIGAIVPRPGYQPMQPSALRRTIARFDRDGGRSAYHILYAKVRHG